MSSGTLFKTRTLSKSSRTHSKLELSKTGKVSIRILINPFKKAFNWSANHAEEALKGSIFLGGASVAPSAGWHVASRGNLSPLTQTHKRLYFKFSKSIFSIFDLSSRIFK